MTEGPYCCHIAPNNERGCTEPPEFVIYTYHDDRQWAGPDPYSDETHACIFHVGELLGMQPEVTDEEGVWWGVRPFRIVYPDLAPSPSTHPALARPTREVASRQGS